MTSATETLVAELREAAGDDKWSLFPLSAEARAKELLAEAADLLTTQSALIETLTRERDEARERAAELEKLVIWAADDKRAAEAALAGARNKALEECAAIADHAAFNAALPASWLTAKEAAESIASDIRALKSA
ncbi:MAG: hypothetical protein KG075_09415 [Alphaproteobacteria bacterium]|nr:hypothetical protein [Alphaproteobacteria bacterium]